MTIKNEIQYQENLRRKMNSIAHKRQNPTTKNNFSFKDENILSHQISQEENIRQQFKQQINRLAKNGLNHTVNTNQIDDF